MKAFLISLFLMMVAIISYGGADLEPPTQETQTEEVVAFVDQNEADILLPSILCFKVATHHNQLLDKSSFSEGLAIQVVPKVHKQRYRHSVYKVYKRKISVRNSKNVFYEVVNPLKKNGDL